MLIRKENNSTKTPIKEIRNRLNAIFSQVAPEELCKIVGKGSGNVFMSADGDRVTVADLVSTTLVARSLSGDMNAMKLLLGYAYGSPEQTLLVENSDEMINLSLEEKKRFLEQYLGSNSQGRDEGSMEGGRVVMEAQTAPENPLPVDS